MFNPSISGKAFSNARATLGIRAKTSLKTSLYSKYQQHVVLESLRYALWSLVMSKTRRLSRLHRLYNLGFRR